MARRGFFAELQHQSRVAAIGREREDREGVRRYVAAVREAEQARRASERAQTQFARATAAERKRFEKEVREAHLAAMEAEVIERNGKLEETYEEIDSLLFSTLKVDDYVDLNSLRVEASHPPFDRNQLQAPIPQPECIPAPSEPVFVPPQPPTGLTAFFGKKKYAESVETAKRVHGEALTKWRAACQDVLAYNQNSKQKHADDEVRRLELLNSERERYRQECVARETEAAGSNSRLDELICNLGYGTAEAIQEYVSIVLSNSVYPQHFQATHEFEFDLSTAELGLQILVPGPNDVSDIKQYKYTRASDVITSTSLSQKECRERYACAIHQVALRSFHEVFESDRRGLIKTISLEVGTNTIDPATGQRTYIPFLIAAAERESFLAFDLSAVMPALTLGKLGAAVSKNPYGLAPAERAGIRKS